MAYVYFVNVEKKTHVTLQKALDELFEMGRELKKIEEDVGYNDMRKFIFDIVQFLRQYKPSIFLCGGDLDGLKRL